MNSKIKYFLVLSLTLVSTLPAIFAAERAPEDRYQHVFFVPECPICFEALTADDTVQTTCRHLFHRHCLDEALRRNNSCPSCRHDFGAPAMAHPEPAAPDHHVAAAHPVVHAVARPEPVPAFCADAARPIEHDVVECDARIDEPIRPVEAEEVRLPRIIIDRDPYYERIKHSHEEVFYITIDNLDQEVVLVMSDLFDEFLRQYERAVCPIVKREWNPYKVLFKVLTPKNELEFGQYLNNLTLKFFNREFLGHKLAYRGLSVAQINRYVR